MEPNTPRPVATPVDLTSFLEKVDYTTIPLKRDLIPSVPREDQQILWVGCVDSYTIETDSIDVPRSELFVHRNLANLLSNGDLSGQAAIEMCMKILKVNHIIICGHYGCPIVKTGPPVIEELTQYLVDLPKLQQIAERFFDKDKTVEERDRRLVELNVLAQMRHASGQESVAKAIEERGVQVHGFVYSTDTRTCERILIDPRSVESTAGLPVAPNNGEAEEN